MKQLSINKQKLTPIKIVAIYAIIGGLWILLSDRVIFMAVSNPLMLTYVQTFKGWVYVAITAYLLYLFIHYSENTLKQSQASLANAQKIAHLGSWEWNIVKNELRWSDEIYRLFGLLPQEFGATYEAFLNSVHPDDREFVKKSVDEALYENKPYSIGHRIVLPDGAERIVHEQAEVVRDEMDRPIQMHGTVQDITEHKLAQMELKKLAQALEQSINIVFITDIRGNIEYVNPMFERVTGWSKEEAIGQTPRILASGETTGDQYQELWATILAGKTLRYSFKNKKKNGQHYWVNTQISPIKNEKGTIVQFLAIQEDITEKKKAEERVEYLAHYNELTGLFNRTRFMELMDKWIKGAHGDTSPFIPLFWGQISNLSPQGDRGRCPRKRLPSF